MRIFIGLSETAGYNQNLCAGFKKLGIDSIFLDLGYHKFAYKNESQNDYNFLFRMLCLVRNKKRMSTNFISKISFTFLNYFFLFICFFYSLFRYDVFIFGSSSFFRLYELPILRFFGKKIIYIFYGSDVRPPYMNSKFYQFTDDEIILLTKVYKKRIKKIERYAHHIVTHPPCSQLFEKKIIPFLVVGLPYSNISILDNENLYEQAQSIRLLHAPSHPAKGTAEIRDAIQQLKNKGYSIDWMEIINQPNQVVLKEIKRCDLVVDELYGDSFMAGLGTEAASFAKPTIIAGYVTTSDLANPDSFVLSPVHHCKPEDFINELEKIIQDKTYLKELGKKAYEFVKTNWSANVVAQKYLDLINNNFSSNWIVDPMDIHYINGYGLNKEQQILFIKRIVKKGGIQALQLHDKPHLEKAFLDMIQ